MFCYSTSSNVLNPLIILIDWYLCEINVENFITPGLRSNAFLCSFNTWKVIPTLEYFWVSALFL